MQRWSFMTCGTTCIVRNFKYIMDGVQFCRQGVAAVTQREENWISFFHLIYLFVCLIFGDILSATGFSINMEIRNNSTMGYEILGTRIRKECNLWTPGQLVIIERNRIAFHVYYTNNKVCCEHICIHLWSASNICFGCHISYPKLRHSNRNYGWIHCFLFLWSIQPHAKLISINLLINLWKKLW